MDNKDTLLSIWERVHPDVEELGPQGRQKQETHTAHGQPQFTHIQLPISEADE